MPTIHSGLQAVDAARGNRRHRGVPLFPVGPGAPSGSGVVHWLDTLISYTR